MTKLEFLKQMPKGKYETYFAPDIDNEILTNALNFIVNDKNTTTNAIYKNEVLAICVVEPELKGFYSLIFTEKALYIKLDGFYNCLLYSEINSVWIDQETKALRINSINIKKYFNTAKFLDFLNKFLELAKNIENKELQKIQNEMLEKLQNGTLMIDDLSAVKDLNFLYNYTDKYGNDAIMISYLYKDKTLFYNLIKELSKDDYSHKNNYDFSFLCLAVIQNDTATIEKYFDYDSYSLLPYNFQEEAKSAIKAKKFSSGLDTGFNIAGSIIGGLFNLAFGTDEQIITDEDKRNQEEKRESKFEEKISNIKEKFLTEYSKNKIKDRKKVCLKTIITFLTKIAEEEKIIPYKIKEFKQEQLKELTAPKGEFEKTDDYNKRLEKAKNLSENFEKIYSQEIKVIKDSEAPSIEAVIKSLNQQIASKKEEIEFLELTLNGIEPNPSSSLKIEEQGKELTTTTENKSKVVSKYYVIGTFKSLDNYDADTESFKINMQFGKDIQNYSVHIPIDIAPSFKQSFSKNWIKSDLSFNDGKILEDFWIEYNSKKYPFEKI